MTTRRTRLSLAGAVLLVSAPLGLAACTGDSTSSADSAASTGSAEAANGPDAGPASAGRDQLTVGDAALASSGSARMAASSVADAGAATVDDQQAQQVISTGDVALRADDVAKARFDVQKVIDSYGGKVTDERSDADKTGVLERTRLVVRVPASDFEDALGRIEKVADLISTTSSAEDVTTQVIDTGVRVRTQRASIARIQLLLGRATSIRDIINIEGELNRRQSDLDSLERRQAYLADQTSQGTITVSVERTPAVATHRAPAQAHHRGFLAGLHAGWSGLSAATVAVLTAGGALLPFAALVLVVALPVLVVRRRRGRPVTTS